MSRWVLLDAGPLGMVTNPRASEQTERCKAWLRSLLTGGVEVAVPEIADYEVRRELLRAGKVRGLQRLDALKPALRYLPLTTAIMLQAAEFWAQARRRGQPASDDRALDGDMILAAQATFVGVEADEVIVATTNVQHFSLFVDARLWQDVTAGGHSG